MNTVDNRMQSREVEQYTLYKKTFYPKLHITGDWQPTRFIKFQLYGDVQRRLRKVNCI